MSNQSSRLPHDEFNTNDIQELVVATLAQLGIAASVSLFATLLVRDGCFIGHKFHFDGGYALWGTGWNSIEFYGEDGKLLKMVAVRKDVRCPDRHKSVA